MEIYAVSVCPICDTEGMNRVWKQGAESFLSICDQCDSLSIIEIDVSYSLPLESLAEDFAISLVRLIWGIASWVRSKFKTTLTSMTTSTKLKSG